MKSTQILTIASLTAAFALTGCEEKKAAPTPPAPEPVKPAEPAMKPAAPAPAPAPAAAPAPAPAAPAPTAPAPAPAPAPTAPPPAAAAPAATSASETAAIEAFKKEVGEIGKFTEEKMKAAGATDPMAGMAAMGEVFAKLKAVKTDAMPADFKTAWGDLNGAFGEMGELFKGLPKAEKPEDGMKAMMELMPKLQALQGKLEPAMKKVEELGKKYGFDMDKLMPKQ